MRWNWQRPDWPGFEWNRDRLAKAEGRFLVDGGVQYLEKLGEE